MLARRGASSGAGPAAAGGDDILIPRQVTTSKQVIGDASAAPVAHCGAETNSKPARWSFMNYSIWKWAALAALALVLGVLPGTLTPRAQAQSAGKLFKQGQTAEAKEDIETAYEDYYKAYQKDPKNMSYKEAFQRTRFDVGALHVQRGQKLHEQGDTTGALTEFLRALEVDPSNELAQQEIQAMRNQAATMPTNPESPTTSAV